MEIKLIVIRTMELEKLAEFYTLLGFSFDYHNHGNSPFHYSTNVGNTVFEIYPLAKNQIEADKNLRLGFEIENFDSILSKLREIGCIKTEPSSSDFGTFAIIEDPDGRKLEIYMKGK